MWTNRPLNETPGGAVVIWQRHPRCCRQSHWQLQNLQGKKLMKCMLKILPQGPCCSALRWFCHCRVCVGCNLYLWPSHNAAASACPLCSSPAFNIRAAGGQDLHTDKPGTYSVLIYFSLLINLFIFLHNSWSPCTYKIQSYTNCDHEPHNPEPCKFEHFQSGSLNARAVDSESFKWHNEKEVLP